MKCPKCGYERRAEESAPSWQCPSCKVAYAKVAQVRTTLVPPPPDPEAAAASRAEVEELEQEEKLSLAARGQRAMILSIVLTLVVRGLEQASEFHWVVLQVLFFAVAIYSLLGAVRVCSGLSKTQNQKILFMVLMFVPLANIIAMLYLSIKTTRMLREAGWQVGLLGAKT